MALIDSLPVPLKGGPRIDSSWLDAEMPSRAAVWREIRGLRYQPPGRAGTGDRKGVFCAALEQAEQMFAAAEAVGDATRPLQLFYGLSQAGRAIAAASKGADDKSYKLTGHGITVTGYDKPLHELCVKDKGSGSFAQLAPLLRSGTLPTGATLGEVWASIPSLLGQSLGASTSYLPPLRFEPHSVQGVYGTRREIQGWVHGLPANLAAEADPEQETTKFLGGYPALAQSVASPLVSFVLSADDRQAGALRTLRCWPWTGPLRATSIPKFLEDFGWSRTLPYLGDDDRWVFPALGGADIPLHPLLAWWALLFALSMLARYEPASWTAHLAVNEAATAVMLERALSRALDVCPQLILHAIRSVGGP